MDGRPDALVRGLAIVGLARAVLWKMPLRCHGATFAQPLLLLLKGVSPNAIPLLCLSQRSEVQLRGDVAGNARRRPSIFQVVESKPIGPFDSIT